MASHIYKEWIFKSLDELRISKVLSSTFSGINNLQEKSHLLAILAAAGLVEKIQNKIPLTTKRKNKSLFEQNTNDDLWKFLESSLPEGTIFTTLVDKKENVITKWEPDRILYKSTGKILSSIQNQFEIELSKIDETERTSAAQQRVGQNVLRTFLLKEYGKQCAMCEVDSPEVLRVSHILPWSENEETRLIPSNSILLCGLHDLCFDRKLITIDKNYKIIIPDELSNGLLKVLKKITQKKIRHPKSQFCKPKQEYLSRHRA